MKEKRTECLGCFECCKATYIGDGGYMCDVSDEIVIDDFEPTDNYFSCDGKNFQREV